MTGLLDVARQAEQAQLARDASMSRHGLLSDDHPLQRAQYGSMYGSLMQDPADKARMDRQMLESTLAMMPMAGMTKLPRFKRHFGDLTGMPMYDEILKNWKWGKEYWRKPHKNKDISLRHITPDEYMEASFKTRPNYEDTNKLTGLLSEYSRLDQKLIDKYATKMKSGTKYDIPVIDLSVSKGQEGAHRAMAAKQLGEKTIPVIWVEPFKKNIKGGY